MTDKPSDPAPPHEKGTKKRRKITKKAPKRRKPTGAPWSKPEVVLEQLTERQILFVHAYLSNGGNATDAYRQAGYPKTKHASQRASDLRANQYISAYLRGRREALARKFEVTEEAIIRRLAAHAFTSIADVMDAGRSYTQRLKSWDVMDDTEALAIKSFSQSDGEANSLSVQMHDPAKAIELLVRYLNLFPNEKGQKNADAGRTADRQVEKSALERIRERFGFGSQAGAGGAEGGDGEALGDPPGGD